MRTDPAPAAIVFHLKIAERYRANAFDQFALYTVTSGLADYSAAYNFADEAVASFEQALTATAELDRVRLMQNGLKLLRRCERSLSRGSSRKPD